MRIDSILGPAFNGMRHLDSNHTGAMKKCDAAVSQPTQLPALMPLPPHLSATRKSTALGCAGFRDSFPAR
jgi:hypothetical protein